MTIKKKSDAMTFLNQLAGELTLPNLITAIRQGEAKPTDILLTEKMTKELKAVKNREIDLSDKDTPEIINWKEAIVGKFYRPVKKL